MKCKKVLLTAKIMDILGITNLGLILNRVFHGNNYVRAINYHSTPKDFMDQFENQLKYYSKYYSPVSIKDLENILVGKWNKDKPGLIISFDDGLESNYKYAKPILEKYNFIGWFFVPAGLIGTGNCRIEDLTGDIQERYMDWGQVKDLYQNHIVGSHTLTHKRLKSELSESTLKKEIYDSKLLLETNLAGEIDVFCWVGGERGAYSKIAADIIKEVGYKFSFLTNHYPISMDNNPYQLERTNIETDWPIYLIKLYTSFFMDFRYRNKREETIKIIG